MGLKEMLQADRRLVILRSLSESPGYSSNDSNIDDSLDMLGHKVSRDVVKNELNWLDEQGLIELSVVLGVKVAKLTQRGLDVAEGQAVVDGVKRPRP